MTRKEKHDGHQTETPDVSHIRNVEVTHEKSDINVRGVLVFVAVLTIATAAVCAGMLLLFNYYNAQAAKEPGRGPMALKTEKERLPPEPRLQSARGHVLILEDGRTENLENQAPQAEYRILREQWENALHEGPGLSIDQAIERVASGEGLQTGKPEETGPPTAASSGREK